MMIGCLFTGSAGCVRQPVVVGLDNVALDQAVIPTTARASAPDAVADTGSFPFPADRGGKLLADLLPSPGTLPRLSSDRLWGPRRFPPPKSLEGAEMPLPPSKAVLPRSPLGWPLRPIQPRPIPEDWPLTSYRHTPVMASRPEFAVGPRVRIWSPDVNEPAPLRILAQKQPDAMPADDINAEVSRAAALSAPPPQRTTPAPFLRLNLPDPYEHRHAVRLRQEPPEDPAPPIAAPRLPGR